MENQAKEKRSIIKENKGAFIAIAIILAIILFIIGFFIIRDVIRGEDLLQGSWKYTANIANAGDTDFTYHFAQDGSMYMESIYATNTGTYQLLQGGESGTFVMRMAGLEIRYDFVISGDTLSLTDTGTGSQMNLQRVN